jgi:hypothetical protein
MVVSNQGLLAKIMAYSPIRSTERRSALNDLLYQPPQPLIDPVHRYGVLRSAKGASKAIMLRYLAHLELLKPATGMERAHRLQVLKKTALQKQARNCDPMTLRWLRIIRDPYNRTVSSYRHALGHGYEDEKIQDVLGISVAERAGVPDIRFLRTQGSDSWPAYEAFLTGETRRKIEQIYAKDFAAYATVL